MTDHAAAARLDAVERHRSGLDGAFSRTTKHSSGYMSKIRHMINVLTGTFLFWCPLIELERLAFGTTWIIYGIIASLACWPIVLFWRATDSTGWLPQ